MSADMMIICEEDNNYFKGDTQKAFFIDETSMGDPWHKFGKWFGERYCKAPGLLEQMAGLREHNFIELTKADVLAITKAIKTMKCHESLDKKGLVEYIKVHIGKHISTENW